MTSAICFAKPLNERRPEKADNLCRIAQLNVSYWRLPKLSTYRKQNSNWTRLSPALPAPTPRLLRPNSILYHLMRNTTAYEKLASEVDTAVADGMLSTPVACAEAVKRPYLKACINEGMRLHPSVGLTMPPSSTRRRNNHFRLPFPRRLPCRRQRRCRTVRQRCLRAGCR